MDAVDLLKDLVSIPSVNPMGREISGPEFLETRLSEYLEGFFHKLGVDCQCVEVLPGRANVIARLDRPGAGTSRSPEPAVVIWRTDIPSATCSARRP